MNSMEPVAAASSIHIPLSDEASTWQAVKPLLADVLSQPPDLRVERAHSLTAGDPRLRSELLSLLWDSDATDAGASLNVCDPAFILGAIDRHASSPWLGRRLGNYQVDSLWAHGGMGDVYLGHRITPSGTPTTAVAIKCIRSGLNLEALLPRFERECHILRSLHHPHLAEVYDMGVSSEGLPYLVMEFVDGLPLDQYCEQNALPLDERLKLFATVCQVVHDIHLQGVVHRDLKFSNILVNPQGVVKLVDFGIAKRLPLPDGPTTAAEAAAPTTRHTATLVQALTLTAASPEQVAGGDITPASDIYSLGVLLYRLLTQLSPYHTVDERNSFELMRAICCPTQAPPSPSRVRAPHLDHAHRVALRGNLDAITRKALQKSSARRYDSAQSLADDVTRHRQGHRARACRQSGLSLALLWAHRLHMRLFDRPAPLR